jgi:Protein of unknown function (DUF3168)
MVADLRPSLRAFLLADAAIFAAVGGARIFPSILPQGEQRPSLVSTRISDVGDHHMQGPSGLARPRYQIDAYAQNADDADELARLVKDRLDGFSGLMGAVRVQGAFFDSLRDSYESEAQLHRVSADYLVHFEEL